MDIHQAVGLNIQRIRKGQKLSIDRAAELAGISKSSSKSQEKDMKDKKKKRKLKR